MTPDPKLLLDAAIHEAAHLVVFVKMGGSPSKSGNIKLTSSGEGYFHSHPLLDDEYGTLRESVIAAAGAACELIQGLPPCSGSGSDMRRLQDTYLDPSYSPLIVAKTQQWLQKHWHLVKRTADVLLSERKRRGIVSKRAVRALVLDLRRDIRPVKPRRSRGPEAPAVPVSRHIP